METKDANCQKIPSTANIVYMLNFPYWKENRNKAQIKNLVVKLFSLSAAFLLDFRSIITHRDEI